MNGWIYIEQLTSRKMETNRFAAFEKIQNSKFGFYRETDGRFGYDKVFTENSGFAVVLDGVLLNLFELKSKYNKDNAFDLLIEMYLQNGTTFMNELRGPFSGVFYDKQKNVSLSFANQTGDTAAYVFNNEEYLVTASDFDYITFFLKENNIPYSFNNIAARYMITFGYMIDNNTFVKEIKRVLPGEFIHFGNGATINQTYYKLQNQNARNCTMAEAVELVDIGFRKAVKRCFDKDLEYGYQHHLADMSAGFDSRMTSWVAREMGYENITNISYSQSVSDELKMARQVSFALGNEFLHMQLDDASFVYDIDDIIAKNYGASYYIAITGGNRILSNINFRKYGLEHTGQLGDVVVGSFYKKPKHLSTDINTKMNSSTLGLSFQDVKLKNSYENTEQFNMYTRGFLGCLSSHLIRKNYTYAVSPFVDVDFMDLCFSLPLELRIGHKLYFEWIKLKYPLAAVLPSSRIVRTNAPVITVWRLVKRIYGKTLRETEKLLYKIGLRDYATNPNNMNPYDYWYETIPGIRNFIGTYYEDNISILRADEETRMLVERLYNTGNAFDKLMVLTVLAVNKRYFVK